MNKKFTKLMAAFALLTFLAVPLGMWGQSRGSYTITFANNANGATAISSSTNASTVIANDGSRTYVTTQPFTVNSGNNYYGGGNTIDKNSIRMGKSGNSAGLTISLSDDGKKTATSIVINCCQFNASNAGTISVNGLTAQSVPSSAGDLTFTFASATDITNLVLSVTKATFICSITVNYSTGPSITSLSYTGTPNKTEYEVGESFDPTGLTVTATYDDNTSQEVTQDVTWTPDPLTQGTTSVTGTYSGQSILVNGITVTAPADPNIVLNKNNTPFSSSTASNTIENVTLNGIEYENYGGYNYNDYLSIKRDIQGYLGNNTQLCGNIKKIVVDYATSGGASKFTMYEGATALAETITVNSSSTTGSNVTYTFSGNNGYFKFKRTSTGTSSSDYVNINSISIYLKDCNSPDITVSTNSLTDFTYIEGNGPSEAQYFAVSGANLTSSLNMSLGENSDFEMTQSENGSYGNAIALTPVDGSVANTNIYVRLKTGKTIGDYNGTITLTSQDATNKTIGLSGSVTAPLYTLSDESGENGSIIFSASPVEAGTHVTLTPTPVSDAYYFVPNSWSFFNESFDNVTESIVFVEGETNVIVMPSYNLLVDATFTAKPTHTVTLNYDDNIAQMEASPASAYEGQTVMLSYTAETGYYLSEIVITKTSDGSNTGITPTASGEDYTFTMPDYPVTVIATFISDTYTGSFVKFIGEVMEEGDYIVVYDGHAMNNTTNSSNNKLGATGVEAISDVISNPSRGIVWHIAPIGTDGKWTIYNANVSKYVNASSSSSTNVTLVDNASNSNGAKWNITIDAENNTYDFNNLSDDRALRYYNGVFGHYNKSNGGPLTLYKYTVLTERTITFNGNGGTYNNETTYTQTVYDGIAADLDANKFTKEGSAFIGWSTTANGEVEYADGGSITVNGDLTLYAQWATSYTAMVGQIVGGIVKVNGEDIVEVAAGTEMTLTYTANQGYAFRGWNVYQATDETTKVTVTGNTFEMPEYDVIVSATFENVATYSLVTNVNQIVSGKHYIIASGTIGDVKVMASQTKNNNRTSVDAYALWDEVIEETEGIYEFVINGPFTFNNKSCYTIYDKNELSTGYLYAASSSNNHLKTQSTLDDNGKWTIEIGEEDHEATIKAQGNYTHNLMCYNSSAKLFACYASKQQDIYLFVKDNDNDYEYYGCEVTYAETSIEGSITVGAGSVMTITNNEFNNDDPAKLIIEDGGQLITDDVVEATIQKNIKAYTVVANDVTDPDNVILSNGWYFISSPLNSDGGWGYAPTEVINLIPNNVVTSNQYDLYSFDPNEELEWVNYKGHQGEGDFLLYNGHGYLYANANDVTLEFAGSLNFPEPEISLENGYNLVGNPYAYNAYPSMSYYKMNTDGTGIEATECSTSVAVAPCTGILVNNEDGTTTDITFSRTAPNAKGGINLALAEAMRGATQMDNAIVSFNEGSQLGKFYFGTQNANLYIPQGIEEYAIVNAEAQGEMPVNFRANEDGQYTLTVNPENVDMNYLHLVDNMTGMDVDLLQTPSYTFNATTRDYESRFRLVFAANNEDGALTGSGTFAFYSNGNWIINNAGEATLQVIDLTGRILSSETVNGSVSTTINAVPGVYMLRLINGENVNVQKIVVR